MTEEQRYRITQNIEALPDALRRDPSVDYTEGVFHVTLNVRERYSVLGVIDTQSHTIDLTDIGKAVDKCWLQIPLFYPNVELIECQVMPEHFHGLLRMKKGFMRNGRKIKLGRVIGGFMTGCTHGYWDAIGLDWQSDTDKQAYGSKEYRKQYQDAGHSHSFRGPALFIHGYNDVEAVDEEEVQTKIEYIRTNIDRRITKGENPALFRIHRNMKSANWHPQRIMQGLCADRFIATDHAKQQEAWRQITTIGIRNNRGKISATLKFQNPNSNTPHSSQKNLSQEPPSQPNSPVIDLIGNMDLLSRPLYPLICHRADAWSFEQQKAAVLRVAREEGAVIVTACVSPKERDIVKLLHKEFLPVIEVMDNGFSERYKPTGKAFYAVAEARRLEVTPWQYEYRRRELRPVKDSQGKPVLDANGKPEMEEVPDITREMCMVMNELVRTISKKADDWWKQPHPAG